jgi:hypothetical protein
MAVQDGWIRKRDRWLRKIDKRPKSKELQLSSREMVGYAVKAEAVTASNPDVLYFSNNELAKSCPPKKYYKRRKASVKRAPWRGWDTSRR